MSKFQVIATLNTHLLNKESLEALANNGTTILRINGSHIQPKELAYYASEVRKILGKSTKILVDLPGNKIRTAILSQPIVLHSGKTFELLADQVNYPDFLQYLKPGDQILANDSLFRFEVQSVNNNKATLLSYSDGLLISNKGMHVLGKKMDLPFLFDRDQDLISNAIRNDLDYVGFSFIRTAQDIEEGLNAIKGTSLRAIMKIETASAIENLDLILNLADEFLVDRGDLSCDVGIEKIDFYQKLVLQKAKEKGKAVYFATQFLHSMMEHKTPLIAEACGLADAIRVGVDGIQLSEETAIGKHPIEVLKTVQNIFLANRGAHSKIHNRSNLAQILWFTGRSGSGKTTLAGQVESLLRSRGYTTCLIDGDDFRDFWGNDLGYTKNDRIKNLRNIAYTTFQAAKVFDFVIVASLSPYRELRDFAREKNKNFHEIYIECSQQTCIERDPKGHYQKMTAKKQENFIGISEEYEIPNHAELVVNTEKNNISQSLVILRNYIDNLQKSLC